jgi:tetratricopeptide (TPR) repeat protein
MPALPQRAEFDLTAPFRNGGGLLVLVVALLAGCQIPGRNGPVSGALLNCRQLTQRGISACDRGDWAGAEQMLAKAIQSCPVDAEARRQYAEVLWRRGASAEALAQMEEAIRLSSDDPTLLARAAEMRLELGKVDAALARAEQALDLDPKSFQAWVARGRVMLQSGQPRQALADYQRALACEPGNREVLLAIAEIYRQVNQPQRAVVTLQSLIDTYPIGEEPQQPLYLAGLAYSALGRHDDAARSLQLAAVRGPATPEILYRLAEAQLNAGREQLARQTAEQALALEPRHGPTLALLDRLAAGGAGLATMYREPDGGQARAGSQELR